MPGVPVVYTPRPFVPDRYDNTRSTARIGDLIRARGQDAADAEARRGAISANLWSNVGQTIAGTIGNMINARQQDREWKSGQPERDLRGLQVQEATRAIGKKKNLEGIFQMTQDPKELIAILEREGYRDEAAKVRADYTKQGEDILKGLHDRVNQHKTVFGQGAQLLSEVEKNPALYPEIRPQLVELASGIDPQLATEIPEQYEPEKVRGLLQFATTAAADSAMRSKALDQLQARRTQRLGVEEADTKDREWLGNWLSTAKSSEDWQASLEQAKNIGVPDTTLAQFGAWDQDAPARAAQLAVGPQAPATAGSKEDLYRAYAKAVGKPYVALTFADKLAADRAAATATRAPQRDPASGVSQAQRAAAERWKQTELRKVEAAFKARQQNELGADQPIPGEWVTDLEAEKDQIQQSYLEQLGLPRTPAPDVRRAEAPPPPPPSPGAPLGAAPATAAPAGRFEVVTPRGTFTFPTQAAADAFKKAAGIP